MSTRSSVPPVGLGGTQVKVSERPAFGAPGWVGFLVLLGCVGLAVAAALSPLPGLAAVPILGFLVVATAFVVVQPGETRVVQFFGRYVGTVRRTGLTWVAPLTVRRGINVRVRNFETGHLKVNDADGNPVEFAAIVVWQVADTARALYAVQDYRDFISVQAESALRHVATVHPYDSGSEGGGTSLRGSTDIVAGELAREVGERVRLAGLEVVEVRISHLAYAPEIAQVMLRRQQANAVVAARSRIVEGAVGMVQLALARLDSEGIVELDAERKAAMVSNLMVVLCGDQPVSPIVNAGSLYT